MNSDLALDSLHHLLEQRRAEGTFRELPLPDGAIDFCSNDYLGLAKSALLPQLIDRKMKELGTPQVGATGSRLISGNSDYYEAVEQKLTQHYQAEAGLLFNSGYTANLGFFASVPQRGDLILADELVHASIRDGIKMSRSRSLFFPHNNVDAVAQLLSQEEYENVYVVVESLYSMDGDLSPLKELSKFCENGCVKLVVDEAHAVGLFGDKGAGRVVEEVIQKEVFARIITFGKAPGCSGGLVVGSSALRDFLINYARPFIYTTALPLYNIVALDKAHDILTSQQYKLNKVSDLVGFFKVGLKGFLKQQLLSDDTPIQSLTVHGNEEVKAVSAALKEAGIYAKAIVYPTVARGSERIRICLHSYNTKEEVNLLCEVLNREIEP